MMFAQYAPDGALCAALGVLAALLIHHSHHTPDRPAAGRTAGRQEEPMATARSILIEALGYTSTDYLDARFGTGLNLGQIADHILTSRDEETLHRAADEYEHDQADQYPGAIYGAIRRIRSFKVGAYLRAMADEATR
ncbi:hypothetical protein ABZ371_00840 [Streptomyces sp. NPDC005899]|uniref:hypothetical protein n=1 Tax=Streptomyces sp. NPDC005899 TaxID=3155716 RepID=UPI00340DE847